MALFILLKMSWTIKTLSANVCAEIHLIFDKLKKDETDLNSKTIQDAIDNYIKKLTGNPDKPDDIKNYIKIDSVVITAFDNNISHRASE